MTQSYADHIYALARQHRVSVVINRWETPHAFAMRTIVIPGLETETHYLYALHEMGHLAHPKGWAKVSVRMAMTYQPDCHEDIANTLEGERAAWEWAKAHALVWTPAMEDLAQAAFRSYQTWAASYGFTGSLAPLDFLAPREPWWRRWMRKGSVI